MLTVIYKPSGNGVCVADAKTMEYALELKELVESLLDCTVEVSQFLIIDAFRVLVKRKEISHTNISFHFEGKHISVDETGMFSDYPKGFGDILENYLIELLSWN